MANAENFKLDESGTLIAYVGTDLEAVIPEGVKHIGERAFAGNGYVRKIVIPNSVESIGTEAFSCCNELKIITMRDSVTSVGKRAFADSPQLYDLDNEAWRFIAMHSILNPELKLTGIELQPNAFENCSALENFLEGIVFGLSKTLAYWRKYIVGSQEKLNDVNVSELNDALIVFGFLKSTTSGKPAPTQKGESIGISYIDVSDYENFSAYDYKAQRYILHDCFDVLCGLKVIKPGKCKSPDQDLDNTLKRAVEYLKENKDSFADDTDVANFRFDSDVVAPNYENPIIRALYCWKYLYAYGFEYQEMYTRALNDMMSMAKRGFLHLSEENTITVTSFGCGTGVDYNALARTIDKMSKCADGKNLTQLPNVRYIGLDRAPWTGCDNGGAGQNSNLNDRERSAVGDWAFKARDNAIGKDELHYIQVNDAVSYFDTICDHPELDIYGILESDIIIFPQFLSELPDEAIGKLAASISKAPFSKEFMYVMIACRPPGQIGWAESKDNEEKTLVLQRTCANCDPEKRLEEASEAKYCICRPDEERNSLILKAFINDEQPYSEMLDKWSWIPAEANICHAKPSCKETIKYRDPDYGKKQCILQEFYKQWNKHPIVESLTKAGMKGPNPITRITRIRFEVKRFRKHLHSDEEIINVMIPF